MDQPVRIVNRFWPFFLLFLGAVVGPCLVGLGVTTLAEGSFPSRRGGAVGAAAFLGLGVLWTVGMLAAFAASVLWLEVGLAQVRAGTPLGTRAWGWTEVKAVEMLHDPDRKSRSVRLVLHSGKELVIEANKGQQKAVRALAAARGVAVAAAGLD